MNLSVIIVSFNTKVLLDNCLKSLLSSLKQAALESEVIVVDNNSTDGSRELLRDKYPTVRTVLNRKNVGFGRANNQGIRAADGEYILLLNSDTLVEAQAIARLYEFISAHPRVFVGPKLLNPDGSDQTSCGPFLSLPVVFAALFLKGDKLGLTRWSPNRVCKVDWVSGAALAASKKLFLAGLLFDEGIFMYMEEIDLLYRARQKGYETYFFPGARITHLGSGSSTDRRKGPILNIYRGLLYFYKKHYSPLELFILRRLLQLKALVAWSIGAITGNAPLRSTYAEAFGLV